MSTTDSEFYRLRPWARPGGPPDDWLPMTDEQQRTLEQDIEEPAKATPPGCPKCGRKLIPIVYGYTSAPMLEASTKNLIKLGGCVTTSDDPEWWCEQDGAVRYVYDELITGSNADVRHLFK